jgi:PAS domain S-box-containing protein
MKTDTPVLSENPMDDESSSNRAICFLHSDNIVEFSNELFCNLTGLTRMEVHHLNLETITHPDDFQEYLIKTRNNCENSEGSFKQRLIRKDKTYVWVERHDFDFNNDAGERIYKVVIFDAIEDI